MPSLRNTIDKTMAALTWVRRNQRVDPGPGTIKVNLGAGLTVAPGWIHVDGSLNAFLSMSRAPRIVVDQAFRLSASRKQIDLDFYRNAVLGHRYVHHQMAYGLPFEDCTVDFVFSSHLLEHFFRDDAERFLGEVFRVLKPGGTARINVPDLEKAVGLYLEGEKERALHFFFPTSRNGELGRHRYLYDYGLLESLMKAVGFVDVRRCAFGEGDTPDLDKLDNRPEQTLYVEATRPA